MHRAFLVSILVFGVCASAGAQTDDPPPPTDAVGWETSAQTSLSASQAAYSNWQEGGVDALAFTAAASGRFARTSGAFRQMHELDLEFGQLKQDTLDFRKAADLIRYGFDLQYQATGVFQPTFALEARTQFAAGFDYDPDPADFPEALPVVEGEQLQVSAFGSPAYLTQVLGVTFDPGAWYTARFGVAVKETIVSIERLRPVYGNALDEAVRVEAGVDLSVRAERRVMENVTWTSRLSAFQAAGQLGEDAPDVIFDNRLVFGINSLLDANLAVVAMFDGDVSDDIQLKEVFSLGLSFTLL